MFDELTHHDTPAPVREWVSQAPAWFTVHPGLVQVDDEATSALDAGEQAPIALAVAITADLL